MFKFVANLFKRSPEPDLKTIARGGATLLDVRTRQEFKAGHARGCINIPLDELPGQLGQLRKDKPVICCCASGMRSGSARNLLLRNGFSEVYNAGSWSRMEGLLK